MFQVLLYFAMFVTIASLICTPILALTGRKSYKFFNFLLVNLYFVQLFMYYPGADVSPYAYAHSALSSIKIFGMTLSAFASMVLILFIIISLIGKRIKISRNVYYMIFASFVPLTIGLVRQFSLGVIDSYMKMLVPFLLCLYLYTSDVTSMLMNVKNTIIVVNILLLVQVIVCKIGWGSFAAYNYYYELETEYFGFYNHPHSFTGLLGVLSIYNIFLINKKEHTGFNMIMLLCNVTLMWLSNVRTYVVALALSLLVIGFCALYKSNMRKLRRYVYGGCVVFLIFSGRIMNSFGSQRVTTDASSGRIARWIADVGYGLSVYNPFEFLFGRGIGYVFDVNLQIFGVSINSLNLLIDLFLDYGVIGMILLIFAYVLLFETMWNPKSSGFFWGIVAFFFVTAMINSLVSYITIMTMLLLVLYVVKFDGGFKHEGSSTKLTSVS